MWARATRLEGTGVSPEEGDRVVRERVLAAARQLEGFKGLLNLVDPDSGRAMTLTLWESREAMERSEEAANRLRSQATQEVRVSASPIVERYEVRLMEMP